jgi:hypothetical protein
MATARLARTDLSGAKLSNADLRKARMATLMKQGGVEFCLVQVGLAEACARKISATQIGLTQMSARRIGLGRIGARQIGLDRNAVSPSRRRGPMVEATLQNRSFLENAEHLISPEASRGLRLVMPDEDVVYYVEYAHAKFARHWR